MVGKFKKYFVEILQYCKNIYKAVRKVSEDADYKSELKINI